MWLKQVAGCTESRRNLPLPFQGETPLGPLDVMNRKRMVMPRLKVSRSEKFLTEREMAKNKGSTSFALHLARCRVVEGYIIGKCCRLCKI